MIQTKCELFPERILMAETHKRWIAVKAIAFGSMGMGVVYMEHIFLHIAADPIFFEALAVIIGGPIVVAITVFKIFEYKLTSNKKWPRFVLELIEVFLFIFGAILILAWVRSPTQFSNIDWEPRVFVVGLLFGMVEHLRRLIFDLEKHVGQVGTQEN